MGEVLWGGCGGFGARDMRRETWGRHRTQDGRQNHSRLMPRATVLIDDPLGDRIYNKNSPLYINSVLYQHI